MEETDGNKKIILKFIIRFISLEIIIGLIAFILENLVPQLVHLAFTPTLIIYQSVIFIISTLLITVLAASMSIKGVEFKSKKEAEIVSKAIKKILTIIAVIVMLFNIVYYFGIQESGYKDVESKYRIGSGIFDIDKESKIEKEKKSVHIVSNIYVITKEIIIVLTYLYADSYIEKMIQTNIKKISKNEENE